MKLKKRTHEEMIAHLTVEYQKLINEQKERAERAEADADTWAERFEGMNVRASKAEQENARLREAMREYGACKDGCTTRAHSIGVTSCNCGYRDALREGGK